MLKISYITYRVLCKDRIIEIIVKIHFYLPTVMPLLPLLPQWLSSKEHTCNAGDVDLTLGSGRSPEEGMATHSSILAWRIPWTEGPCGLQSRGLQELGMTQVTEHACMSLLLKKKHFIF